MTRAEMLADTLAELADSLRDVERDAAALRSRLSGGANVAAALAFTNRTAAEIRREQSATLRALLALAPGA